MNKPKFIKKGFCGNCGKYGHIYAKCREPIISLGVINIKIDVNPTDVNAYLINKYGNYEVFDDGNKNIIIPLNGNILYNKINDIQKFCLYKNAIKFLMIRRKNTLGYIEFIRGHYDVNDPENIISLFEQMVQDEITNIEQHDFDYLWKEMWAETYDKKNYEFEYKQSKAKFEELKNGKLAKNLFFYTKNVRPEYTTPEWGFPKGRRNFHEKNYECAIREFNEESGFTQADYIILNRMHSLNETFTGTNGVKYKHIYYLGLTINDKKATIDVNNPVQFDEIGDIGWFTYDDAMQLIRPYHYKRKKILTEFYMFLLNDIIENIDADDKKYNESNLVTNVINK